MIYVKDVESHVDEDSEEPIYEIELDEVDNWGSNKDFDPDRDSDTHVYSGVETRSGESC